VVDDCTKVEGNSFSVSLRETALQIPAVGGVAKDENSPMRTAARHFRRLLRIN
jgi:hypothetical protein